jgi:prolyl oligopeptidase
MLAAAAIACLAQQPQRSGSGRHGDLASGSVPASQGGWHYPAARRSEQVDDYHGVLVPDPYRWLEDPRSPETRHWIGQQNDLTFGYLQRLPQRDWLRQRLERLWNYERWSVPISTGGRYFYLYNNGLQNQSVLYVQDTLEAEPRVLLDPNTLSPDATVALVDFEVSPDGRFVAYALSEAGSDWRQWRVREVDTARDRDDHLLWSKFSGAAWSADSAGFYYARYDEPDPERRFEATNYHQKLYYHRLGTTQADDQLVYARPDHKEWGFAPRVTDDGRYLVIHVWRGSDRRNAIFYRDLQQESAPVVELIPEFDASHQFVGNDGRTFWLLTDYQAPRYRVVAVDLDRPQRTAWREVIAEAADALRDVAAVGGRLVATYLHDAHHVVRVFGLDGRLQRVVELPGVGSVGGFSGRMDDRYTFYSFSGFTTPGEIYRYDVHTGQSTLFRRPKLGIDPDRYVTRQEFCTSRDGTQVPLFITHRHDLPRDGRRPALLYGYGGFNISLSPGFSVSNLVWMELGGVYAMANLRGGGEYGRAWHEAGRLANKQNVFDDFIAAAEHLIAQRYTCPARLAISGRSNGGLLVGACLTQRPDLFAAAVPGVGVLDMLRYHRFTIGWAWVAEYGSADDPQQFPWLLAYSPLHNIRPGTRYPATLILTADHDDRVVPAHSFKFAAALQHAQAAAAPVLIRVETSAGHGAGKPVAKQIEEAADVLAFLTDQLELSGPWQR